MRRPIRPFTVEKKRGSRPTPMRDPGEQQSAPPPPLAFPPEPQPPSGGANWAAAEALFKGAGERKSESSGRILQSLVEPPPAAFDFDVEPEQPRRRGRKPGSRNKPKAPAEASLPLLRAEDPPPAAPQPAPVMTQPAAQPIMLRRRGRIDRAELPRGERWKARLPRFAR